MLFGKKRQCFIDKVEQKTDEASEQIQAAFLKKTPSGLYSIVSNVLHTSMLETFPNKKNRMTPMKSLRSRRNEKKLYSKEETFSQVL